MKQPTDRFNDIHQEGEGVIHTEDLHSVVIDQLTISLKKVTDYNNVSMDTITGSNLLPTEIFIEIDGDSGSFYLTPSQAADIYSSGVESMSIELDHLSQSSSQITYLSVRMLDININEIQTSCSVLGKYDQSVIILDENTCLCCDKYNNIGSVPTLYTINSDKSGRRTLHNSCYAKVHVALGKLFSEFDEILTPSAVAEQL